MDAKYYLLLSTGDIITPEIELHPFDDYSVLCQYLQDRLFMDRIGWYQIYWGDVLMQQKVLH